MKTWKKITWLGFSVIGLWSIDYKQTGCVMSRGKKEWQRVRSRAVPAAHVWCIGKRSQETKVRMVLPDKSRLGIRPVCGVRRWEEHGQGGLQTLCFSDKETEVRRVGRLDGGHTVSHRPAEPEARSPQSCRGPPQPPLFPDTAVTWVSGQCRSGQPPTHKCPEPPAGQPTPWGSHWARLTRESLSSLPSGCGSLSKDGCMGPYLCSCGHWQCGVWDRAEESESQSWGWPNLGSYSNMSTDRSLIQPIHCYPWDFSTFQGQQLGRGISES